MAYNSVTNIKREKYTNSFAFLEDVGLQWILIISYLSVEISKETICIEGMNFT